MEYIELEYKETQAMKALFESIIGKCIAETEDEIREAIKFRWLKSNSVHGGKIKDSSTGMGYSRLSYKALKIKINPSAGGNVDLTLTGSLGNKIEIIKSGSGDYEIISTDSKYNAIGNKYGFDEFGLDQHEMIAFMKVLEYRISNKLNQ
jgi:hypothetical protein